MPTITKEPMRVATTLQGEATPALTYIEAAAQAFLKGALMVLASGKAAVAGADPARIDGVALQDATGVTDTEGQYTPILPNLVFIANLAVAQVLAQADVGAEYGVTLESGNWHVDTTKTAGDVRVRVLALVDEIGDVNGRVSFVFLQSVMP